jgi:hypothetical protein
MCWCGDLPPARQYTWRLDGPNGTRPHGWTFDPNVELVGPLGPRGDDVTGTAQGACARARAR